MMKFAITETDQLNNPKWFMSFSSSEGFSTKIRLIPGCIGYVSYLQNKYTVILLRLSRQWHHLTLLVAELRKSVFLTNVIVIMPSNPDDLTFS